MGATGQQVKPIILGTKLKCSACGVTGMQPNRRTCYECGAEFITEPWRCGNCGADNLYRTGQCLHCGAVAEVIFSMKRSEQDAQMKPVAAPREHTSCKTLNEEFRARSLGEMSAPSKPTPPPRDPCAGMGMKWYYYLIYAHLIICTVGNFLSSITDLFSGSFVFALLWIALGADALYTRSTLVNKKTHAPSCLLGYFLWSGIINAAEVWFTWEATMGSSLKMLGEMTPLSADFGENLKYTMIAVTLITSTILICCNASYFKKRKAMFVN